MSRYIDADKLKNELMGVVIKNCADICLFPVNLLTLVAAGTLEMIEDMPTADVQEVKHGRWIDTRSGGIHGDTIYRCSYCGNEREAAYIDEENYCWKCGARMDLEEEEV